MINTYAYYYGQLSPRLQCVYLSLLNSLQSHEEKCTLPLITVGEEFELLDCIVQDQPILSAFRSYNYRTVNDLVIMVEPEYILSKKVQKEVNDELIVRAKAIASYVRSVTQDPVQQVKVVYQYFSKHVEYDGERRSAFTAAGGLLYGRAVCMGISLGFKLVMDVLEIPSIFVSGEHEGESHAWNLVNVHGMWLPCDLTVGVCQSTQADICYDGLFALPYPEKYKASEVFRLPKL